MAKKISELRARMSPEAQARAAARAEAMLVEMQLQELRKARKVTQVEVAKAMSVEQAAVAGVWLHGQAGDEAVTASQGLICLTASEVIQSARRVLARI